MSDLVAIRVIGVSKTKSGAVVPDKLLVKCARLRACTEKLVESLDLHLENSVKFEDDSISIATENVAVPLFKAHSKDGTEATSAGLKGKTIEALSLLEDCCRRNIPVALTPFLKAVINVNKIAFSIKAYDGEIVLFPGKYEFIFPAIDPKKLRVRRPDLETEEPIENRLAKGCQIISSFNLASLRNMDQLVSVLIYLNGNPGTIKATITLERALGRWLVLVSPRIKFKHGEIPEVVGDLNEVKIDFERLSSEGNSA